jgi:hypothetical protein
MYNNNQGFSAPEDMAALFEMYFHYIHMKFQKKKIVNLYAVGVAGIYFPSCGCDLVLKEIGTLFLLYVVDTFFPSSVCN